MNKGYFMKETILIKVGEIALKGLNRRSFEDVLIKNIKRRVNCITPCEVKIAQSTIAVTPYKDDVDFDEIEECISKIFGIATYSRACIAEKNMESILSCAKEYLAETLNEINSFKVESKRSDKKFPLTSPEISREVGGFLAEEFPHLIVDVHNPDLVVTVEVRDYAAFIRGAAKKGAGGIPVGTGGNAVILISGGIDSPVAAWTMAKRGLSLTAVHFASPPYTSERAEDKVVRLLKKVSEYSGRMQMYTVPFTKIQEQIKDNCPEELFTIIMRRFMMQISERIAREKNCGALITGESLGQVASQTIGAIGCTDEACRLPVFRPLIGKDKEEIIEISRKIDTFDISIEPFEDFCTVFTPKHPRTKPVLKYVVEAQNKLPVDELIDEAVKNVKVTEISF